MSVSDFVSPTRCPTCGRLAPIWTPEAIVAAMQEWKRVTGYSPTSIDWQRSARGHPNAKTVQTVFGSWRRALRAAGLRTQTKRVTYWTAKRIADAMTDFRVVHGRWPRPSDWRQSSPNNPSVSTVYLRYETWEAALYYAGRAAA